MTVATFYSTLPSPVGPLTLVAEDEVLVRVGFEGDRGVAPRAGWVRDAHKLQPAAQQLEAYFAGRLRRFDLPLGPRGTAFQQLVWSALLEVPFGATASYGEIARAIGRPSASRAIGGANHRNPLAIVIPCHRVIGANGSMTGYGGGLGRKRLLLDFESRLASAPS